MRAKSLEFLEKLIETPTPSGYEAPGQKIWRDYIADFVDTCSSDAYGNTVGVINPGGAPRLMIAAHMDEIALVVNYIDERGFLKVQKIGGVNPTALIGQRVWVHSAERVAGVIGEPAVHLRESDENSRPKVKDLWIDIGAKDKEDAERRIAIGSVVTCADGLTHLLGSRAVGRGFDNRTGVWTVAETARLLSESKKPIEAEVLFVSNVMEEIGALGIRQIAYSMNPDAAITFDVTHALDYPGADPARFADIALGRGPVLTVGGPNHPAITRQLQQVAELEKIRLQREATSNTTGTDADEIFWLRGGIPTGLLGLPTRYMHSPGEVIDLRDLESLPKLTAAWLRHLGTKERFNQAFSS